MSKDPSIILRNILDIVNYPEDKNTFINQFGEICMKKGLADLVNSLSEDAKSELEQELAYYSEKNEFEEIVCQFVSAEKYKKVIQDATSELFEDFLKLIEPTLTTDQNQSLDTYLASL